MSLQRYTNRQSITALNRPQYGEIFLEEDLQHLNRSVFVPKLDGMGSGDLVSEVHVYTLNGDYVGSSVSDQIKIDPNSNSLLLDIRSAFYQAAIERGTYKAVMNLLAPLFGKPSANQSELPAFVREISPDRTEIKMVARDGYALQELQQFVQYVFGLSQVDMLNNVVVNFTQNQIYRVVNVWADPSDLSTFYVKLYTPIHEDVTDLASAWFAIEMMDPYIDTIVLTSPVLQGETRQLAGPRFDIDVDQWDSQATMYQSWNDLLDVNAQTAQRIIDLTISGSGQATINIDYTDFGNFVFYSSAEERLENFRYKMELIESYSFDNSTLLSSTGSGSVYVGTNILANQARKDSLLSSLDPFERWLYYHATSSLFTHDVSGSVTPWPKREINSQLVNHSVTSSIAQTWFTTNLETAQDFDRGNQNSLWWSIPEHVLMDPNNSEYTTFVNMIGQHFDNMYMYIDALTQIHNKDEHPERGASSDLLYHIARSYGWELQNTRQLSSLWLYKLGTDQTGSMQTSSGMQVLPHENQTKQIWKRIVNNLPYLLKTKGTARSVKALMSIYGIPQSLISIKEYGGPGLDSKRPIAIEDTFAYKLNVSGSAYIKIPLDSVNAANYGWGTGAWCGGNENPTTWTRTPDTYEFRFSSELSGSLGATPLFVQTSGSGLAVNAALSLVSSEELGDGAIISGSRHYGKVLFETFGTTPQYSYSEYLPIYDGDLWTIRLYNATGSTDNAVLNRVQIARASDCLYGRITHDTAISMSVDYYEVDRAWLGGGSGSAFLTTNSQTTHNFGLTQFDGYVQGYKEYFTICSNDTFHNHVRNPRAYNTDSVSGSFYSLYRYLPLGLDLQREDHTVVTKVSSSQPDQESHTPSLVEFVDFEGTQATQYESINETMYMEIPRLGGTTLASEKIRFESSYLKYELSPESRGEAAEYDDKPADLNKLAIVFSPSDQINRDIYNHMGFDDLDHWIGDPEEEFKSTYPTLNSKSAEYFQKYQQYNDVNAFIRILSLYDYTFFEQIKQLVPGRADLIAGILIEPHVLQRSKVQLSRLPSVSNPQWSETIQYPLTQSGKFPTYQDTIEASGSAQADFFFESGSVFAEPTSTMDFSFISSSAEMGEVTTGDFTYISSSIADPILVIATGCEPYSGSIQIVDPYTGMSGSNQVIVDSYPVNCRYKRKTCYYDAYYVYESLTLNPLLDSLDDWELGGGVTQLESQSLDVNNVNSSVLQYGIRLSVGAYMTQSLSTTSGTEYFVRMYVRPLSTESTASAGLRISVNGSEVDSRKIKYYVSGSMVAVNEYRVKFVGSGTDQLKLEAVGEAVVVHTAEVYNYISSWTEGWIKQSNKERGVKRFCTLESWNYQIDECSARNRSRFIGSKLSGPGINIDSPNTVDGGPVVRIIESNPNALFFNESSPEGNLRVD